jgi:hypothetical protein
VRGTVTFDNGPPPAEGAVFFAPIAAEKGYPRRPARARFGRDGTFAATSFEPGDGLVPGEYRVSVECWKVVPSMGGPGVSYVGSSFAPENLVVNVDQRRVDWNLDVPLAK